MKSFKGLLALLTLLSFFTAQAATKTWTGAINSDWTNGGNWGGTAPAAGDIANIPGGLSNYPIINNTVTIATVNINSSGSGASVTVTTSGTFNVTVLLTVNANGSFIHNDGESNINALTVNGTVTFTNGTMYSDGTLTVNNGGVVNQSGGLIHMAVNAGTLPTDNLLIASGGTYNQSGGILYIKDWAAGGGTFNQTGATALFKVYHDWKPGAGSVFNSTAGTVEFTGSGGGGPNFAAGTRQFCNLLIDAGVNPVFDNVAGSTIPVSGNFTNNNSSLNVTTSATFVFNGSATQTIYSASTGTNATFGNLEINNTSSAESVILQSNIYVSGNLTVTDGTFDQATYTVTRTAAGGTFSMATGTYLTAGGGAPSNWTSNSLATGSYVIYNGAGTETIAALNYANLVSTNTGARILASSGTIGISESVNWGSNSYTITGSTVNFNGTVSITIPAFNYNNLTSSSTGTRILSNTGTIGIAGTFTPGTNSYTITGSTIDFNGTSSQTIAAFDYNHLTSSNSGARVLAASGTIGIYGTFSPGSNSYTISGSTIEFKGSVSQTIPAFNYNNLTSSSNGARIFSSSGIIGIAGNFIPGTNSYTITGSTLDYNGSGAQNIGGIVYNNLSTSNAGTKTSTGNLTVNGIFTVNAPTVFSPGASYTVSGGGSLTGDGTIQVTRVIATADLLNQYTISTLNVSSLAVDYAGAGNQTVNALNYGNLTISTNGTRTVTLNATGSIGISGTFSPTSITTTYVVTGSTVNFNGAGAQSIPAFAFNNLSLSNGGTKSSAGNIVVNNLFTINSGIIFSAGPTHIISGSGTLTGNGEITVSRITATPDFASQYTITNKNLSGLSVDYNGAGAQTINNGFGNYSRLKISGSGTKSLQGAVTITGDLVINAGTLDVTTSNFDITVGGNFTNNAAAANFTERNGTVTFNGTGAQSIDGTSGSRIFYNVVVTKTSGQLLSCGGSVSSLTVNDLTLSSGNFTAPASFGINGNVLLTSGTLSFGSATIAGNWTNNGGSVNGSSIIFSGTSKTIGGSTASSFPDLTITTGSISLNTNASCTSFTLANNNVANSFTLADGVIFTVNGAVAINQASGGGVIHALNVNGGNMNVNGDLNISVLTNNAGRVAKLAITTGTVNVTGDLVMNNSIFAANGVIDMSGGAGNLNLYGNFNVNTLGTFSPGSSSTVSYLGTGSQNVAAGSSVNYNNLVINKPSGTATLAAALSVTNITLTQGVFSTGAGSYLITLAGNWTNNGGTFSAGTGDVLLNGTGTIGGTNSTSFYDLSLSTASTGYFMSNNNSCNSLTIDASATSSAFTHSGTAALTVANTVTINQPTATATLAWNINAGSATVGGLINFAGTNNGAPRVGQITITSGTLNAFGGISFAANTAPASKVIDMSGGAGVLNLKGALTFGNLGGTLNAGTAGSIFNYADDAAAQTVNYFPAGAYHNLHFNNTGSTGAVLSAAITTTNVTGNLRVQSGTLSNNTFGIALNNSKTFEVSNGATFKMNGNSGMVTGTSIIKTFGATSTCDYTGTAQTVSAETYGHLVLSTSGIKTLPGVAMTIQGNFTTSGTISTTAATSLTVNGNVLLGNGTSFNEGSTTHNIGGNWTNNGCTITTGTSTINFNGTAAQTLGGTSSSLNMYNLTISNTSAAVSVNTNTNVSNTLNMNGATTILSPAAAVVFNNAGATGTLTGNGTVQVTRIVTTADYSSQYKFTTSTLTNLTVDFAGAGAQSVNAFTYGGLKCSGSGTKTASGNLVVNNTLTISSGITLDMNTYALSGTLAAITGTGTLKTQNTGATPIPSGKTWSGTIMYYSSSAQNIIAGNYNNLDASGGNRTLASAGTIGISGTFTTGAGTYIVTGSTVDFNGSSAQTIPALTYNNITCSGGSTKNVGGTVNVIADLTLGGSTTLSLGSNNIRLKSDSTYTARVATLPASAAITYGTGRFTCERFIKGRRRYRLMTSSVTSSPNASLTAGEAGLSIWGNWQNSGNNAIANNGTFITGGSSSDGFDTQTTNASLFTYDAAGRVYIPFSSANGKNTKFTPLKAGVPYYMFVWGDRTNSPISANPNKTVLVSTGTLLTGDQTYNSGSTLALTNTVNGFTMIGNPFASPINWATVSRTNLSDTYWGWDPNLNSTGGYVTVSTTGTTTLIAPFSGSVGLNQYIQPGQGFFVKTTASSPVLVIKETDKVSNFNASAFRTQTNNIPLLAINLFLDDDQHSVLMDGALLAFDPSFSNAVNNEDATKLRRPGEELAIREDNELLSIDSKQLPADNDSLQLFTSSLTEVRYRLQVFANKLDSTGMEAWLCDRFLNNKQLLSLTDTNNIIIDVNRSNALSYSNDRFYILFRQAGNPAGNIISVNAVKQNRIVHVSWNVPDETGIIKYEVEKTQNGSFQKIGQVIAIGQAEYKWIDFDAVTGMNNYRVKLIKADGSVSVSGIVTVNLEEEAPVVKVYPNPVTAHQVYIRMFNASRGKYMMQLYSIRGEAVFSKELNYDGGNVAQLISLNPLLVPGMYTLRIYRSNFSAIQKIFIK